MTENKPLRDYLLTRRSVGLPFLKEPGPDAEQLRTILTIGMRVPDHGKLAPWRLIVIQGENRALAGEKLAAITKARNPAIEEAALEVERKQFLPAPLTIGVLSAAQDHIKVPRWEQYLSAGNVAFNIMHGANALGFAASWVTRWYSQDQEAAAFLGAREGEQFIGFIHIGTPSVAMEDRTRPQLDDVVTYWTP